MRARTLTHFALAASVAAAAFVTDVDIAGQTTTSRKPVATAGGVPRLHDGHPDLQGTYDLGTLTPLERRAGTPLVLTDEEAKHLEQQVAARSEKLNAPIDANRPAPPSGGDGSPGPYGNVGGYNNFWLDPGSRYTTVDGRKRASLIVDPTTWTKPWTAEYTWPATDDLMYQYACHEGNYAMGNILRGARLKEVDEAKKTKQQ